MMHKNIRSIDVLMNNGFAYVNSSCLTEIGLFLVAPPYLKIDWQNIDYGKKMELLLYAFDNFRTNVPVPNDIDAYLKVRQDAFQIDNLEKFYSEASMCHINLDLDKKEFEIVPDIYLRESDSHYGIKKGITTIAMGSPTESIISAIENVLKSIPELTSDYYKE